MGKRTAVITDPVQLLGKSIDTLWSLRERRLKLQQEVDAMEAEEKDLRALLERAVNVFSRAPAGAALDRRATARRVTARSSLVAAAASAAAPWLGDELAVQED